MDLRGIVSRKKYISYEKSQLKNPFVHLSALVIMLFLVDIAIIGALLVQDKIQNSPAEEDLEYQDPIFTFRQSYTYTDGKNSLIELDEPKVDNKNVRGDTYSHPLTNDTTILFELDEIAIGTLEYREYGTLSIFDDTYNQLHEIYKGEFSAKNENGADMVKGNFDEDPLDELVLSYELDFMENGIEVSKTQVTFFDDANSGFEIFNTSVFWITYAKLCAGDFDGDGLDEVAMVGNHEGEGFMAGVVFDDFIAQDPILHIWDHVEGAWEENPNATKHHDIAAGDFDGDSLSEVVTVGRINDILISWVWKLNDDPEGPMPIYDGMELIHSLPDINSSMALPSLAAGNIDGDLSDELIVTAHDENFKLFFRIYDDFISDFEILKIEQNNISIKTTNSAMGDIDGDGLDEIFVVGSHVANPVGRVLDDAEHNFTVLKVLDRNFEDKWYYWYNLQVDCGDVDGDGIEEYVMLGQSWLRFHGELYDDLSRGPNNTMIKKWVKGYKLPSLAVGNFDGDGFALEYAGEHESVTTFDTPVLVMAVPPFLEGSNQNNEESKSGFGVTEPEGSSGYHKLKISTGLSMSFEGKPIELVTGTRSALLREFAETETPISASIENISFEGNYPEDYVIYQNTTYDVYKYKILSWPGHEDRVGENITINVPLSINMGYKTLNEFNSENGEGADIGNETFLHTPGDLLSYPNSGRRNSTLDDYPGWSSDEISVGQGDGYTSVILDLENEDVNEEDLKFGLMIEDHVLINDERFTSSRGLSSDMLYEVCLGESIQFEGKVGNFKDTGEFKKHGYSYGMFVYQRKNLEEGHTYMILNYWVEGYGGHVYENIKDDAGSDNLGLYILGLFVLGVAIVVLFGMIKRKR